MKTQQQAKEWINSHTNKGVDFDGMYGYQCMDLAVAYIYYVTDGQVQMWGNAKDAINNNFKGLCTVYRNTPSFKPELGDVAVYTSGFYATYGHIQVVISGNLNYYVCLEQNWNGNGASYQELATVRTHYYDGVTHFIRPHFTGQRQKQSKNSKNHQNHQNHQNHLNLKQSLNGMVDLRHINPIQNRLLYVHHHH